MTISKKLITTGIIGLATLNPLSINLIADVLTTAINKAMEYLVIGSGYIMVASGTLIVVGGLIMYSEAKSASATKLKKLKHAKTSKAGNFLED